MTAPADAQIEWIRPPLQARTQQTLARLLDASEALLAERPFDAIAVADIARRADSSVGGFYRRFRDKDALLHSLHERYTAEALATAEAALDPRRWAGARLPALVRAFVEFLVRIDRRRTGLRQAVAARARSDPAFRERSRRLRRRIADGLAALLRARRDEFTHPDPAVAAPFVLRQVFGVLGRRGDADEDDPLSEEQLVAELTRACVAYLGAGDPPAR